MKQMILGLAAVLLNLHTVSFSQENQRPQAVEVDADQVKAESLLRARSIRVSRASDGSKVDLMKTPVLRYSDPTRKNDAGSVWVWGKSGRPQLMVEIYHGDSDPENKIWVHAMSLTSTELLQAETDDGRWMPRTTSFELQEIPKVRPPSEKAVVRLRQMKAASRSVSAHEFWDPNNTRYELRLLVTPVYRYSDPESGLVDGAVFVFAHGTNPEILMFVEARAKEGDAPKWYRGFAPLGSAELVVAEEEQVIWRKDRAPGIVGRPTDPYWLFVLPESSPPSASDTESTD